MVSSRLEMCENALRQIEESDLRFPGEPALASVATQLRYLIHLEHGEEADRSRLKELTLGRFAVYELSNIISDDLSKLLCDISDGVRRQLRREARAQ
jgi:hypothetical protein